MSYYRTCNLCGGTLDANELCECQSDTLPPYVMDAFFDTPEGNKLWTSGDKEAYRAAKAEWIRMGGWNGSK